MSTETPLDRADVGVFGGSGFYRFLRKVDEVQVATPYGDTSAPVALGVLGTGPDATRVAFLPRHGVSHELPPHRVPYRANAWALHHLGVRNVIGPCAVGSLRPELVPEDLVVPDQLVDRTWGRPDTFCEGGVVEHLSFADPYTEAVRQVLLSAARAEHGERVHDGGTVCVIQGPRFSTRAESRWFRQAGWDLVNMTQHPEVALCRELGMGYGALALVTDHDAGLEGEAGVHPVTMDEVFAVLARNVERTQQILRLAIPAVGALPTD